MIENKNLSKLVAILMIVAVVLSIGLRYFPDSLPIEITNEVSYEYESKLFDKDSVMTIDITIDEDAWNDLIENATDKEYQECDITINGETFSDVGIRAKGNTTLSEIASDDTTDRYSFKVEFDHYIDSQTCYGLDKLALNNIMSDATYMKEYMAYDMLTYMGVPTSLYSFASITVNGEPWGVYLAVEVLEESYAARNFGSDYGDLYKPESTGGMANNDDDSKMQEMTAPGEANTADTTSTADTTGTTDTTSTADTTSTTDTTGTMDAATPPDDAGTSGPGDMTAPDDSETTTGDTTTAPAGNTTTEDATTTEDTTTTTQNDFPGGNKGEMGGGGGGGMSSSSDGCDLAYTDDDLDSYSAIWDGSVFDTDDEDHERVVEALKNISEGNLDGYLDVDTMLRYIAVNSVIVNYDSYFGSMQHNYYLYEDDGELTMLPWDYNLAFAGFQSNDSTAAVNDPIDTPVSGTTLDARPLVGQVLEQYSDEYHEYLSQIVEEYFNSGYWEETIDKVEAMLDEYVQNDATAFYTYDEFKTAVATLKEFGLLRAESVQGQLDGTIPSTSDGQSADDSALIDASSISISDMGTQGGGNGGGGGDMDGQKGGDGNQMGGAPGQDFGNGGGQGPEAGTTNDAGDGTTTETTTETMSTESTTTAESTTSTDSTEGPGGSASTDSTAGPGGSASTDSTAGPDGSTSTDSTAGPGESTSTDSTAGPDESTSTENVAPDGTNENGTAPAEPGNDATEDTTTQSSDADGTMEEESTEGAPDTSTSEDTSGQGGMSQQGHPGNGSMPGDAMQDDSSQSNLWLNLGCIAAAIVALIGVRFYRRYK